MTLRLYFDEDAVRHASVHALRVRGVDVVTPSEAGMCAKTDGEQLAFATSVGRAIFTYNAGDFCRLHAASLAAESEHAGIIIGRQQSLSVGEQTRRLIKLISRISTDQMQNRLEFLSDWA